MIVCILEVEGCEILAALSAIEEVIGEWKWILIFLGNSIESSIIHAESEVACLLLDKEDWSGGGRR